MLRDVVIECYEERIVEVVVKFCDVLCGSESQFLQKHTFKKIVFYVDHFLKSLY